MERNHISTIPVSVQVTARGLPLDTSALVPLSELVQPVMRSMPLDVYPVVIASPALVEKKGSRQHGGRSNSINHVMRSKSPARVGRASSIDDGCPLQKTKFTVASDLNTIKQTLSSFLEREGVVLTRDENGLITDENMLSCSYFKLGVRVTFWINLLPLTNAVTVEFVRQTGCTMLFNRLYHAAAQSFTPDVHHEESVLRPSTLPSVTLSEPARTTALDAMRRWIKHDHIEGSTAFASMVASKFLVGADVVQIAVEMLDVSLLHGLSSLATLARSDAVEVSNRWTVVKPQVVRAIQRGDAHEAGEAITLCIRMQAQPELSSKIFVDTEIQTAARDRLNRDTVRQPNCLVSGLRNVLTSGEEVAVL